MAGTALNCQITSVSTHFPLLLVLLQSSRKFFPITFFGSISWIAVFSYLMVWWAHQVRPWEGQTSAWLFPWLPGGSSVCLLSETGTTVLQLTYIFQDWRNLLHLTSPHLLALLCSVESSWHSPRQLCGGKASLSTTCPLQPETRPAWVRRNVRVLPSSAALPFTWTAIYLMFSSNWLLGKDMEIKWSLPWAWIYKKWWCISLLLLLTQYQS